MFRRSLTIATVTLLATGLTAGAAAASPSRARLLGEQIVPFNLPFQGTTVGGLSSIDRDPRTGQYVLISDDRSAINPARFYTAEIDVDADGVHSVQFTGTHPFLRPDGKTYPTIKEWTATPCTASRQVCDRDGTVDPEELRVDPWTGNVTWSQEGERILTPQTTLLDPSIRQARPDGGYVGQLPLPADERMSADNVGPRQNQTLEGITYAAAGTLLVSEVEDPLLQDGPDPTATAGALTRITVQSRFGPVLAQYAYPIDPLFAPSPSANDTNGVSSMVADDPIDPTRYLMVERAFVTGVGNKVRVYEIDTKGATNVRDVASLAGEKIKPVSKKLLVDLDTLGLPKVDNIEGITWGPTLPSGERTLLLVSDNNFNSGQITQVIALAVR
ncbi:esterase-like activity of phytase family protein [Kutzneria sp. NPDC052558]|uniref:esterase-like activity of phytase family protein n=1 Tax=Kutzneria sp. NPDC052558 TaxID=3364121 RepID=UPI0037CA1BB1